MARSPSPTSSDVLRNAGPLRVWSSRTTARMQLTAAVLSFAAYCTFLAPGACALDPSQHVTQYAHRTWTIRAGFTTGPVFAITQTTDGYLWLGTVRGLVRFDGVRAVPWVPPGGARLPSSEIRTLLTGHDGTLWIGTKQGLVSWKSGRTTEYEPLAGLAVYALTEGSDGTVWAAGYSFDSNGELCSIRPNQVHCAADARLGRGALGLHVDRRDTLWAAVPGGLWRWAPGTPQLYPIASGDYPVTVAEDGGGALLIPELGRLARLDAGALETASTYPSQVQNARGALVLRDRDGTDWIGTISHGLIRVHGVTRETLASADGLTGDTILALFEDREGSLWVATDKGLDRFSASSVVTFSEREGLASPLHSLVAAGDGSIWTSTGAGRIFRIQNGQVTVYQAPHAPSNSNSSAIARDASTVAIRDLPQFDIASLFQDARGRIWVVGRGIGGYFLDRRFISIADLPRGTVYAVAGGPEGDVWISNSEHGLVHLFYDRVQEVVPWSALGQKGAATALAIDPKDQSIWIGSSRGGITDFRRDHLQRSYTASNGLGSGRVSALRFDADGTLWVATNGGLSRLRDGHLDTITANDGLPCNRLYWSVRAHDRSLWLYGECGLVRIASAELEAWFARKTTKIQSTLLDASDGVSLFSSDLSQSISPQAALSPDGSIWFRTFDGLSVIRPHNLERNPIAPPVHIERLTADGVAHELSRTVRLPAQIRDLAIEYTALSFVAPEKMHFRYRLQGQDTHWREVLNDREVQYSNLSPGNYRFQVVASNNSGVWNDAAATLDFSIAPAYWQTTWFRALCMATVLLLLWALYWLRLRQVTHTFDAMLEARVNERTRIARELHDTLLQSLHGLMFQFQAVRNLLPRRPDEAIRSLDHAIRDTESALAESRDAIRDLRSDPIAKGDLEEFLMAASRELAKSGTAEQQPPVFELIEEGEKRALSSTAKNEIYRVALEILRNAYRHANATRIEAETRYDERGLRVRIRDNGRGIDSTVLKEGGIAGHWGLRGARERAERIGARLDLWSEAGAGTEVQLTVPAEVAYQTAPDDIKSSLLRKVRNGAGHS
jgi:signal transduction histidine kinase/ligand-binding sensor domain-containing protein